MTGSIPILNPNPAQQPDLFRRKKRPVFAAQTRQVNTVLAQMPDRDPILLRLAGQVGNGERKRAVVVDGGSDFEFLRRIGKLFRQNRDDRVKRRRYGNDRKGAIPQFGLPDALLPLSGGGDGLLGSCGGGAPDGKLFLQLLFPGRSGDFGKVGGEFGCRALFPLLRCAENQNAEFSLNYS